MLRRISAGVALTPVALILLLLLCSSWGSIARAQQPAAEDGPTYANGMNLIRPANYREWMFLSSSLGLTYQPPGGAASSPAPPVFQNVFVNPSSYRSFMQTG